MQQGRSSELGSEGPLMYWELEQGQDRKVRNHHELLEPLRLQ